MAMQILLESTIMLALIIPSYTRFVAILQTRGKGPRSPAAIFVYNNLQGEELIL